MCLSARNSNVVLIGDSQERFITGAIYFSLKAEGLIRNVTETSPMHDLTMTTTNDVRIRYMSMNTQLYTEGQREVFLDRMQSDPEKDWTNNVVMFGSLLWPLVYTPNASQVVQDTLPHFFELFRSVLEVPYNVQMIWKTTHWTNQTVTRGSRLSFGVTMNGNETYHREREEINVFGNALATEYGWDVIDDYSPSYLRIDQLQDACHYGKGSSLMEYTMQMLRQRVCDWNAGDHKLKQ